MNILNELTPIIAILVLLILLWSFLTGIIDKSYYKNLITNQRINFHEIYFDRVEYYSLLKIMETNDFDKLTKLYKTKSNGIKLEIAYTDDKSLCFVQLVKYMPFQYALRTPVKQLTQNEVDLLFNSMYQTSTTL